MSGRESGDARGFTRVGVRLDIALDADGLVPVEGTIRDVSASGLFVECPEGHSATEGSDCSLSLTLGGDGGPVIRAAAHIVRVEAKGIALRITEVNGEEGFVHLRNLVLYNAPDADAAMAEFDAHVGLKRWDEPG